MREENAIPQSTLRASDNSGNNASRDTAWGFAQKPLGRLLSVREIFSMLFVTALSQRMTSEVRSLAPSNAPQVRAFSGEVGSIQPAMPTFTDPVTEPEFYSASQGQLANIPPPADPTRFGFRDGLSFGFDNTRLTNPLNGVQLDLQGAPTADFGPPGCDEWDGFCRMRDLEQNCNCGGLKVNPWAPRHSVAR